jgi:hypothetical protein
MKMNQRQLEKMIGKMMNVIKPNGVSNIDFKLRPMDLVGNSYNMSITYIVPDDNIMLRGFTTGSLGDRTREQWNHEISKTISDYFDVEVIIGSSGVSSESYHNRLKQY